ncbi:hypothetical protein EYF80_004198 [Liparis tanakae]|uniref:Uncharacterized protein n=1 Tax=Liparis tanakae TaxID=230148 RepID=A0A4Z2J5A4_9TELE|nr:hypothetical protein EYF80_004198 [Liparis tanakae]
MDALFDRFHNFILALVRGEDGVCGCTCGSGGGSGLGLTLRRCRSLCLGSALTVLSTGALCRLLAGDWGDHLLSLRRLTEEQIEAQFASTGCRSRWRRREGRGLSHLVSMQPVHLLKVLLESVINSCINHGLRQDAIFRGICCCLQESSYVLYITKCCRIFEVKNCEIEIASALVFCTAMDTQRLQGRTCQATPSLEISLPDMPSVRFAMSEHF